MTESGNHTKVLGYVRVSTDEQARSGAGIEAQKTALMEAAERRGWDLDLVVDDGYGAGDLKRPGIIKALERLEAGEADVLVAAKLDRLSRSVLDFASLLQQSEKQRWGLVLLDLDLDTTKPTGRLVANVMASVAEFERQRISERTKEALAAVRARGVRLGRPPVLSEEIVKRIRRERRRGAPFRLIADRLNKDNVPTAHGGRQWWPSTVKAVADARQAASPK